VDPVTGAEKTFGFVEFESAEGAWNCVRMLNDFPLFAERLLVKVDSKTQAYLDRWLAAKRAHSKAQGVESSEVIERRSAERLELSARRVLDEHFKHRETLVARMPRAGHADGRRATPEPEEIEQAMQWGVPPKILELADDAVARELEQLRVSQERRGQRLSTGVAASAASSQAARSSAPSGAPSSSTRGGGDRDRSGSDRHTSDGTRGGAGSGANAIATAAAAAVAADVEPAKSETELQAARDARERERVREVRRLLVLRKTCFERVAVTSCVIAKLVDEPTPKRCWYDARVSVRLVTCNVLVG
jgi:hypothetical protein